MMGGVFLISISSVLVLLGTKVKKEKQKKESLSMDDAKMFPIFGSIGLLILFLLLKYIPKDFLNTILRGLFSVTGVASVYKSMVIVYDELRAVYRKMVKRPAGKAGGRNIKRDFSMGLNDAKEAKVVKDAKQVKEAKEIKKNVSISWNPDIRDLKANLKEDSDAKKSVELEPMVDEAEEPVEKTEDDDMDANWMEDLKKNVLEIRKMVEELAEEILGLPNIAFFGLSIFINGVYLKSKNFVFSNMIACSFAITGLQEIHPDSTATVLLLLGLLFVYDIFWVFFTPVMISVAKGIELPIKIVYPVEGKGASMIGLGDVVIPGLYLSVAREFSEKRKASLVFRIGFVGYVLSLIVTFAIVMHFKKGQPALLYICPMIVGATMAGAWLHHKTREFVQYKNQ